MKTVITGAYGRVGTSLLEHQSDEFEYIPFDKHEHPELETFVGDISVYETVTDAFDGTDAVVHLAADPNVDAGWESILRNNIIGAYNCLEACRQQSVESVVLASSNHVVGMYEEEYAPELYEEGYDFVIDHRTPIRPDSLYGTSKVFLEGLGRYYVENYEYPKQVYALRIGSVRYPEHDHPFGDAEAGVKDGRWKRGSEPYTQQVKRMKATWQSRRDVASLIECCLADQQVTFTVLHGVSDNLTRWFDIEHAHRLVGYEPQDRSDNWDAPPENDETVDTVAIDHG